MKECLLVLALALFSASALAISETSNGTFMPASKSDTDSTINESIVPFALLNLIEYGMAHPVNPIAGLNSSLVASGNNASINLVQAVPGTVLKMHYHKYSDEISYTIRGEANFTISGKNYTVKAGDLIYIPSMTLHRLEVIGNETIQAISIFAPPYDGDDRIYIKE